LEPVHADGRPGRARSSPYGFSSRTCTTTHSP
jgi:hypothetical protein